MSGALRSIAAYIDHTLLKSEAGPGDIDRLCDEARLFGFAAVCVNPMWVERCAGRLGGFSTVVASVCGFPLGAVTTALKVAEAREAISNGAAEIDVVACIGLMKSGAWLAAETDVRAVVEAAEGRVVKVIIETAVLAPEEITRACAMVHASGARFVKTSTGLHPLGGATVEVVKLMRAALPGSMEIKASGGVRDCVRALEMLAAGATRIGTSAGAAIARCLGAGLVTPGSAAALADQHRGVCTLRARG